MRWATTSRTRHLPATVGAFQASDGSSRSIATSSVATGRKYGRVSMGCSGARDIGRVYQPLRHGARVQRPGPTYTTRTHTPGVQKNGAEPGMNRPSAPEI